MENCRLSVYSLTRSSAAVTDVRAANRQLSASGFCWEDVKWTVNAIKPFGCTQKVGHAERHVTKRALRRLSDQVWRSMLSCSIWISPVFCVCRERETKQGGGYTLGRPARAYGAIKHTAV